MDLLAVEQRAFSGFGKIKFFEERVEHGAHQHFSILLQSDGNAADGNAVGIIDGAIDGIDDPFVFAVHNDLPGFLTEDEMIGKEARILSRMAFSEAWSASVTRLLIPSLLTYLQVFAVEVMLQHCGPASVAFIKVSFNMRQR